MHWLTFALALELIPSMVPQGQVARIKAPGAAVSARFENRTVPLFMESDGTRAGLVPVPALEKIGAHTLELLDASGRVIDSTTLTVQDARFRQQNVRLGGALSALKPAPGEMEAVAALRGSVSPVRYWTEPFELPVPGCMTSPFGVQRLHNGKRTGNYHGGIDQRGPAGTPVQAVSDGMVKIVRKFNVHGDTVGVDHGHGMTSFYLHLSRFAVSEGARVKKGEVIGYVGSSGRSTAPHLHWSLSVHGVPVNPAQWLKFHACGTELPRKRRHR